MTIVKDKMGALALAAALAVGLAACHKAPEADDAKPEAAAAASAAPAKDAPKPLAMDAGEDAAKPAPAAAPAAVAATAAPAPAAPGEWVDFKLGATGFSVKLPAAPECRDQQAEDGMKLRACAAETKETGMIVNVSTMPGTVAPDRMDHALVGAMNGSAKSVEDGKAVEAKDIELGGVKGKDFIIRGKQGDMRSRILIEGPYLIQVVGMAKQAPTDTTKAESEKFVSSLAAAH